MIQTAEHLPDPRAHLIPAWDGAELRPLDKMEVHLRGLRHKAVSVFVLSGSRTLLQRRAAGKYHTPGLWANACCTHPMWGEDPAECARRRLRQELGADRLTPVWRDRIEYRAPVGGDMIEHEVVDLFVAEMPGHLTLAPDPDEVMALRWIDLDDLAAEVARDPGRFTPWLRIYIRDHRDAIFGAGAGADLR